MKKILFSLLSIYSCALFAQSSISQYDFEQQMLEELDQTSAYSKATHKGEAIPLLTQENKDLYLSPAFNDPLIIFVFAQWCAPCKQFTPIVEQLCEEHSQDYLFLKLNVDNQLEMTRSFGVTAIPTLLVMKKGEVKGSIVGGMPKEALWDRIEAILNEP